MHITVLLNMTEARHLERLKRLAQSTAPLQIEVRELFCQRVDRIKDAEVYCIGVGFASESLRALKDAWTSEEQAERRQTHVPYDSEGHVSLVYVRGECRQQAESFVEQHRSGMQGGSLTLDHITYQDEFGKDHRIALTGRGDGPPPRKVARRGSTKAGPPKEIDGSVLEGGGQILRMSSSYSVLFGQPIHIAKIRAGRSKPGLAAQHLESLRLARDVSAGSMTNDWIGSCDVTLTPGCLSPGTFWADPGTAGAITLMVQASLVPLLFAGGDCKCELKGGTDVSWSPPLDFLRHVLRPTLARMGASFDVDCPLRGFFPAGGGHVQVQTRALEGPLSAVDLGDRGAPKLAKGRMYSTKPLGNDEQAAVQVVRGALADLAPEVIVEFSVVPGANNVGKYWLDVVVETSTGALFHGGAEAKDLPGFGKGWGKNKGSGTLPERFQAAAAEAAEPLRKQLATGAAVDCHLADQLILPASLAAGTSRLLVAELSMHARTAIHIAELMVPGVKFREEKRGDLSLLEIDGVAYFLPEGDDAGSVGAAGVPAALAMPALDGYDEDIVSLPAGALTKAAPELREEFENDMAALAEGIGAKIVVNVPGNHLVISGKPRERKEVKAQLKDVLDFYFGSGASRS